MGYIYKITSPSGKIYIGQTTCIKTRIQNYRYLSCKTQRKLYNSFLKYGFDSHQIEVITECCDVLMNPIEILYITLYNSVKSGLNLTYGGSKPKPSLETRQKISAALKGRPSKNKGMKHSQETKDKLSQINKGRISGDKNPTKNPETREKVRRANTGKIMPDAAREKLRKAMTGRIMTEEWKRKISESQKGRKLSPEQCRQLSERQIGLRMGRDNPKFRGLIKAFEKTTGVYIGEFESSMEASIKLGVQQSKVIDVVNGKRLQTGGYIFIREKLDKDKNDIN